MASLYPTDTRPKQSASLPIAAPTAVRWGRKVVASKPRSQSSSIIDSCSRSRQNSDMAQKHDDMLGESPWPANTIQTTVSVDPKARHQLVATASIHRRLCFSLDEKALFDLHHPQYSSTASQQQSSEQSPHRMALEPIKPPFEPPERVRTPDGVPSWPGVMETCAHTEQRGRAHHARRGGRREQLSRMIDRILKRHRDDRNGKRARIRRALGLRRPYQEQRTVAQWRPPISGHSTFRFSA